MSDSKCDVVIVGGGIMGSSTAYNLMKRNEKLRVTVVERDPMYQRASTALSWGNIRIHFSLKENIQISQYAMEVFEKFEDEMSVDGEKPFISWHRDGNLFLTDEKGIRSAKDAFELQKNLGCQIEWLSVEDIKERYPLYEIAGMVSGTFGPNEGYLDGYALLMAFKSKAKALGAKFISDEVTEIQTESRRIKGVALASGKNLKSDFVINCAGAWAGQLALTAGVILPIAPTMRQVFAVDTAVKPDKPLPLTVFPSGFCFRSETGNLLLVGKGLPQDDVGFDFVWKEQRFIEVLWPELAQCVPAFDTLKLVRGWAGLYDVNTLDGNAILGEWPEIRGLFLANGFSGHGLQQAPAVGRYLSELILEQRPSLDLSIFTPVRILERRPVSEAGLV